MELKTFIRQAILDIIDGVREAQKLVDEGVVVSRADPSSAKQTIEFEIAVGTEEKTGGEAKIGVFSFGAGANKSKDSSYHSTIKVKVPINFPMSGEPKKRMSLDEMQNRLTGG